MSKLFAFSGQLNVGKDHVAIHSGLETVSIAEPIYAIASHYLGTSDKKDPKVRRFLQVVGMWGRGEDGVAECHGISLPQLKKDLLLKGSDITKDPVLNWQEFSKDPLFWLKGAEKRSRLVAASGKNVVITNARFDNEINMFAESGFRHYHIMCDEEERRKRMERPFNPEIDMEGTEKMSYELTKKVFAEGVKSISAAGVVWNSSAPSPIAGTLTVAQFAAVVADPSEKFLTGRQPLAHVYTPQSLQLQSL